MMNIFRKLCCKHEPKILSCHKLQSDPQFRPTRLNGVSDLSDVAKMLDQKVVVQILTCEKCGKVWHFNDRLH